MKIDSLFDNKYRIKKILGKGGMGTVYLAENIKLGNQWAIKQVKKDREQKIDLLAEPNMLKKLNHIALPRIFDIIEYEEYIYIVIDYVEGTSLDKELKNKGAFSEKNVIEWGKQICDALIYLHENQSNPIIYRDMKPSNLMINKEEKIKIIDFGIAREYKEESESDTTYIGTRGYAAPEQYGTSQTDARTDIYSLGVTLYHLLTGKSPNEPPFELVPVREINDKLSVGIEYIISKCIQLDPGKRYQSGRELLSDLTNIHKFSKAYKRYKRNKFIKIMTFFILISSFSYLTYVGFEQLNIVKSEKYSMLLEEGISLWNRSEYDEAKEKYNEAISLIPTRAEGYLEVAKTYFEQKEYDNCIEYIINTVFVDAQDVKGDDRFLYMVGTSCYENKDYESALRYFEDCTKINPDNETYKRDMAICYAKLERIEEAIVYFEEVKSQGIKEDVSWYVDGEILYASKDFEKAIESFENSIDITRDEEIKRKAFLSSAEILQDNIAVLENAHSRLISILERANSELESKNDMQIVEMLGKAYYSAAMIDSNNMDKYLRSSVSKFETLLSLGYNRAYLYRNISGIYTQLGELDKSEKYLLDMKGNYPEDYTCYRDLAILYAEKENKKPNEDRDYSKTVENYELAIKYSSNGEETIDLQPLIKIMNDLEEGNWIN